MRSTNWLKSVFLCTLLSIGSASPNYAQVPSLAASDAYFVTVKTEFGNETFTIIRDGRIEEQFYFVPARPHVAVETVKGKKYPVFQLLSFQRKQADNTLKQGGILQLSLQMGISEDTQDALLKKVQGKFQLSDSKKVHRLSPIPMKEAQIAMYDMSGDMMDSAPVKEGVAPIFGNQQFPFMLNLTDLGSDAMESLCRGRGGLPVIVTYTFLGMTEPGGFKVEVNWDSCFKHFSTDTKLRAKVGYKMLGADLGADFSTIREEMISNGMIKVTSLTNEAMSESSIDAAMNPILNLITAELFEGIKAPPAITPAAAKEIAPPEGAKEPAESGVQAVAASGTASDSEVLPPVVKVASPTAPVTAPATGVASAVGSIAPVVGELAKTLGGAATTAIPVVGPVMKALEVAADIAANTKVDLGASFALKDVKIVKKGKFTYTYDRQAVVERKTSFGGPIGIGSFDKKTQDACITVLPDGNWESAFYLIPPVGDPAKLGFKYMTLSVIPVMNGKAVSGQKTETAMFNKNGQGIWQDKNGNEVSMFLFPLKAVYASAEYKADPSRFKFQVKTEVIPAAGSKISTVTEAPMFDGEMAMAPAQDLLEPVFLSGDCLSFGGSAEEIFVAKGTLKADNLTFNFKLDANTTSQGFLIPKDTKSLKIMGLQFISKTGKKYSWANNGRELKAQYPDMDIMFFDNDWQAQPDADAIVGAPAAAPAK